jgi:16S rRNA G527 N7-methylase RsmG
MWIIISRWVLKHMAVSQGFQKKQIEKDFFSTTFDELSGKFTAFVDLFSEIAEKANMTSNQDVLKLYEKWLYTKSKNLLEKLQKMGIQPIDLNNEDLQ